MLKLALLGNESSRSEVEQDCTKVQLQSQLLRSFKTKENHMKKTNSFATEQLD